MMKRGKEIYRKVFGGSRRTALIKKNIGVMFMLKGWYGLIYLFIVPLTLSCLGTYENGLWLTISAALVWIDNLDIGLGNGLRNKLAEYLAANDYERARQCVSSTLFMLVLVIVPATLVMLGIIHFIDIYRLLGADQAIVPHLESIISVAIIITCTTFIFKFIGNVYYALQLPAVSQALLVGGQTLILAGTFLLKQSGIHSLLAIAVVNTASPLIVYLAAYPLTFGRKYRHLAPSVGCFRRSMIGELMSLGVKFFVLQIAAAMVFTTSTILVSHLFTPEAATPYNITFKYLSITMMVFTVIGAPFWSATTDACACGEMDWIRKSIATVQKVLCLLGLLVALLAAISQWIYGKWVPGVAIPWSMTLSMAIYIIVLMVSSAYSFFLDGFGKLSIQLICTCTAAVVFIPLAYVLSTPFGVNGIIYALIIVNLPGLIANYVQLKMLVGGTARGIWNR